MLRVLGWLAGRLAEQDAKGAPQCAARMLAAQCNDGAGGAAVDSLQQSCIG